jgi:transposase
MFRHWNAGRSQVQIHQALGIDRKTIRKYLAPALAEGLAPCPAGLFEEELWRARIQRWFPELVDPMARALSWGQIAAHHQWIADQLGVPVTVATIAQRLRDDHQVEVSESTVRRYIATTFAEACLEERVTVPRGAVEPGSEAQIDYGKLGMWFDPVSGRRVAVWVFAMILSCSRALFVQPVLRMDQTSWNASHVAAFEFFGGVPARLVCDNLKTGVARPDLYDPQINLAYGELAMFYGRICAPSLARRARCSGRSWAARTPSRRTFGTSTSYGRRRDRRRQCGRRAQDWGRTGGRSGSRVGGRVIHAPVVERIRSTTSGTLSSSFPTPRVSGVLADQPPTRDFVLASRDPREAGCGHRRGHRRGERWECMDRSAELLLAEENGFGELLPDTTRERFHVGQRSYQPCRRSDLTAAAVLLGDQFQEQLARHSRRRQLALVGDALDGGELVRIEPHLQHLAAWVAAADLDVLGVRRALVLLERLGGRAFSGQEFINALAHSDRFLSL